MAFVVYFDQFLGAARTQKLVKKLFSAIFNLFCSFQSFFSDFTAEIKALQVIVGLFFKFTIVKMKGPNKRLNT